MNSIRLGLVMITSGILFGSQSTADSDKSVPVQQKTTWKSVLQWLPTETEVLFVAQGPYNLKPQPKSNPDKVAALRTLAEKLSYSSLSVVGDGAITELLDGVEVEAGVAGYRRFLEPRGLGVGAYEGCEILVLKNPLGEKEEAVKRTLKSKAIKVETLVEHEVFSFEVNANAIKLTYHVVCPEASVLICSTSRDYLKDLLTRRADRAARSAFPPDLPIWKHVDTNARFWAIRHNSSAADLAFDYEPEKQRPPQVNIILNFDCDLKTVEKLWTYEGEKKWAPVVKKQAARHIVISSIFQEQEDEFRFFIMLLSHLGFRIAS